VTAGPAFSVLVPIHNAGVFLRETVESVLAQTCSDFELILIDDGSTDDSLAGISSEVDARIRVLRQQRQGTPSALNAGLQQARGEFIALIDHDDIWLPTKLAAHRDCLVAHSDVDLTFDWSRTVDESGADLDMSSRTWKGSISFEQLLEDFVIRTTSAIVIRRAAIEKAGWFRADLLRVYDLDLCLRIAALKPENCRAVPQCLTLYRRHERQMSRDWQKLRVEWKRFLRDVPRYAPRAVFGNLAMADSNMHRYFSWLACEEGRYASAVTLISSAFLRLPHRALTNVRNWMVLAAALGGLVLPRQLYLKAIAFGKKHAEFAARHIEPPD
jgi:glycosyltransferase involved in cell wall biosynthesis